MTRARDGLARLTVVLALAAGLAPGLGADPRESYKRGVDAVEAGQWADAARFLRAAIKERGEERAPLIGARYVPHYYLGVALAEHGDCRGALAALAESRRQGKIDKVDELNADLEKRRQGCEGRLQQLDEAKGKVEELLGQTDDLRVTLATLAEKPMLAPLWSRGEPSYASREASASARLDRARQEMQEGYEQADAGRLERAAQLVSQARNDLESLIDNARNELGDRTSASAEAVTRLEAGEEEARKLVRSLTDLRPYPPELEAKMAAVETALATIQERKDAPAVAARELDELGEELGEAVQQLRSAATRPPRKLSSAVTAFLAGEYPRVVELLDGGSSADPRVVFHTRLLLAAARHALFVLGGEGDRELLDQASRDAVACAESDPTFAPSPRYFSPRFIDFYRGAEPPPEPETEGVAPAAETE